MDPIAASLAEADEEEALYQSAKGANIGTTVLICRWRRRALESFEPGHDIVRHYDELLERLKIQLDGIHHLDHKVMNEALFLAREIGLKYGNIKEKDITPEDHIKRHKPDEPKPR